MAVRLAWRPGMPRCAARGLAVAAAALLLAWGAAPANATLFGEDDRLDLYEADARLAELARSTCLVSVISGLRGAALRDDGTHWTIPLDFLRTRLEGQLCPDERFSEQPAVRTGYCSASLIAADMVVTAGHCTLGLVGACDNLAFLFDFAVARRGAEPSARLRKDQVYFCRSIEARRNDGGVDFSIVRLDRAVTGRSPIRVAAHALAGGGGTTSLSLPVGTPVANVGYPSTLPLKIAPGAVVALTPGRAIMLNTDTFAGNSGSAIIDLRSLTLIGTVDHVEADVQVDAARACIYSFRCPLDGGCGGPVGWTRALPADVWASLVALPPPGSRFAGDGGAPTAVSGYAPAAGPRFSDGGWVTLAHITVLPTLASHYRGGYASRWVPDTVAPCAAWDGVDPARLRLRAVMGEYTDYFRPVLPLCQTLTQPGAWYFHSYAGEDGPWRAVNGNHGALLGGFTPYASGDTRVYGPFWGAPDGPGGYHAEGGGCCHLYAGEAAIQFWRPLILSIKVMPAA